ncbi:MAG: hypothetical protein CMK75_07090, partial [Pseudomonadales bacterium]|nr:hypothetical protein [Pseudomonadales bacterium]
GEGDLIHGSNESYRFGDGCIIADFGELFRPSLMLGRWTVIALVAFGWHYALQAEHQHGMRWRAVTWLILLELVLGQGMVVKFLALLTGTNG